MSKAVKLDDDTQFGLPPALIGRSDVSRLLREIERVDYELETQEIRTPGQPLSIPNMSRGLTEVITLNNVNVTNITERKRMLESLREAKDRAPNVQITFAVDPAPEITSQIVAWIRQNLHPRALVTVGLQPSIMGGCVVRTPDHIYDFSLRKRFKDERASLIEAINASIARK